ncbi:translational GTPase TypA [Natranaerobius thermophilus]|uniref:Large ribosomal subunit assembly factor BipA n=1 Tax=Natranaerobius thermophilus (strain ATCC BAA-1301 / DSM 18059 / JW/NM-WN-LF) TaxID=457570 RepID=B2A0L8_NATTJ|nr:translational GTPase TypA [Natranaerobius thermophilus]ACB84579.1 GTP-binding protein TypA [Natranaerobius thermophilus JW/NM-WN-LF]
MTTQKIRNIALIAHVDHGKTTLVDSLLKQSGVFHEKEQVKERVMDSNDQERERGITILSKNTAIKYNDTKINIVDTPGHADFGGEVERIINMVEGGLLLVDAVEGPMPQTKFVLEKALSMGLVPIVVINKIDRPQARPQEVADEILDLFFDLEANEDQLEFPILYTDALKGIASHQLEDFQSDNQSIENGSLKPLFDTILEVIPSPKVDPNAPFQMLVSSTDYDSYLGKYAVGKIMQGTISKHDQVLILEKQETEDQEPKKDKQTAGQIFTYQNLEKIEVPKAEAGDIAAISGLNDINIGATITDPNYPEPLPSPTIEAPTISMTFSINNSPFAGQEGKYLTSRKLKERLFTEQESNISLKVEETDNPELFQVSGRGELHLSTVIEKLRREGYEFQVSKPQVIYKEIDGKKCEPIEEVVVTLPDEYSGTVIEEINQRKGELLEYKNLSSGNTRLKFKVPSRGLIGFRSEFLTLTRGTGLFYHNFLNYEPYKGDFSTRVNGALVAHQAGEATFYSIQAMEDRGEFFISPGVKVYEGMIVGQRNREGDLDINVCKQKQLTNVRAAGSDNTEKIAPPKLLSLEEALEFINQDELVEITPNNIRLRKKTLKKQFRK